MNFLVGLFLSLINCKFKPGSFPHVSFWLLVLFLLDLRWIQERVSPTKFSNFRRLSALFPCLNLKVRYFTFLFVKWTTAKVHVILKLACHLKEIHSTFQGYVCDRKNTGVGSHTLLQGILLTEGSNLSLSHIAGRLLTIWATREAWF